VKKPGKPKPKPKRRAQPQPQAAVAQRRHAPARNAPAHDTAPSRRGVVAVPRTAMRPQQEERTRLALLLLPFLIVAVSLAMAQSRRNVLPNLPEIAALPPVGKVAVGPAALPPAVIAAPLPPFAAFPPPLPASIAPPATPPPRVAALDVHPAVPPPAVVVPKAVVPTAPLPAFAAFPPPRAHVEPPAESPPLLAALDLRPAAPPVAPVTPPPVAEPTAISLPTPPDSAFCAPSPGVLASFSNAGRLARAPRASRLTGADAETFGKRISAAALAQTQDLVIYTARYQAMAYPMGDVLALHGACIDVLIRAYRSVGIDLQEEIQRGRPSRGDTNIEHRRTENMRRFLERNGASLPVTDFPENYKPGDIVTYHRPHSRVSTSHIAIVTDVLAPTGRPMIVHNRGYGPQLEDALFVDRITGHYRYMGQSRPDVSSANATGAAGSVVRAGYSGPAGGIVGTTRQSAQ